MLQDRKHSSKFPSIEILVGPRAWEDGELRIRFQTLLESSNPTSNSLGESDRRVSRQTKNLFILKFKVA
jgi:hypothetical protein